MTRINEEMRLYPNKWVKGSTGSCVNNSVAKHAMNSLKSTVNFELWYQKCSQSDYLLENDIADVNNLKDVSFLKEYTNNDSITQINIDCLAKCITYINIPIENRCFIRNEISDFIGEEEMVKIDSLVYKSKNKISSIDTYISKKYKPI